MFLALFSVVWVVCYVIKQSNEMMAEEEKIIREEEKTIREEEKTLDEATIQKVYSARQRESDYDSYKEKNLRENIEKFLSKPSDFCLVGFYKINKRTSSYIIEEKCGAYFIHKSLINLFSTKTPTSNYYCAIFYKRTISYYTSYTRYKANSVKHILYSEKDIELDYDFLKNFLKTP